MPNDKNPERSTAVRRTEPQMAASSTNASPFVSRGSRDTRPGPTGPTGPASDGAEAERTIAEASPEGAPAAPMSRTTHWLLFAAAIGVVLTVAVIIGLQTNIWLGFGIAFLLLLFVAVLNPATWATLLRGKEEHAVTHSQER